MLSNAEITAKLTGHTRPPSKPKRAPKVSRPHQTPKGSGIVKNVKDFIKGRPVDMYPPKVRKFIADHSNHVITGVSVMRQPIAGFLDSALNAVSLGQVRKRMATLGIDKLRHLYVVLELLDPATQNRTSWMLEKNQVIVAEKSKPGMRHPGAEVLELGAPANALTVGELFKSLLVADPNINIYDSIKANCQVFVAQILKLLGLWNDEISKFVKQNVSQLLSPFLQRVNKMITDTAARLNVLAEGAGKAGVYSLGGCQSPCGCASYGGSISEDRRKLEESAIQMRNMMRARSNYQL